VQTNGHASAAQTNGHANGHTNGTNGIHKRKDEKTKAAMAQEDQYSAHNYHPLPVCFERGLGAHVWDVDGNEYIDCLSAYSAVNQGHCHPRIVAALTEQAQKLTLSSRAFHSNLLGTYAEKITKLLGFEAVLPMNTGAEAVETAMKISRRWGYMKKGIPEGKAIILACTENFHGRTISVISMSTDEGCRTGFGPFMKQVGPVCPVGKDSNGEAYAIRFGEIGDLEKALDKHGKEVAAFIVEPIQGEAGIIIPPQDYLSQVSVLCKKHNVLFICDEVQTGFGRTGKMMCHENFGVKPDMITLGKALSGGIYPVSAVLTSREIMDCITPGSHGSTYGGNPLGCACAIAALDVLIDEKLSERAAHLGEIMREGLRQVQKRSHGVIEEVRGYGLLNAVVIGKNSKGRGAWELCLLMKEKGLLAKPTHENTIRLAPPLVISEEDVHKSVKIIDACLHELDIREYIEDISVSHGGSSKKAL